MYKNKSLIGFVPARGGSKEIPGKNIISLAGKPLIQYTIETALRSKYLDTVVISTDSNEIAQIAEQCGARAPFLRPPELSSDTAKTIDAVLHTINTLASRNEQYDALVLLQPTQPFRNHQHVDEAIEHFFDSGMQSLASVCRVKEHPVLMRTINSQNQLSPICKSNSTIRRQEFEAVYKVNGAIYINAIDPQLNEQTSLNDNVIPYIMERDASVDIDTFDDLQFAEELIKSANKNGEQ